jgi:hypothetical protein
MTDLPQCTRVIVGATEIRTPHDLRKILGKLEWKPQYEVCEGHEAWETGCLCSVDIEKSMARVRARYAEKPRGIFIVEEI